MGYKHTVEIKKLISKKRKEYLSNNKDKHNWSLYSNQETKPEKLFRGILEKITNNIKFYQYYIPPESNRFFEIDFAIPSKKIGYEINGNQHYDKNWNFTEYHVMRKNYLEKLGWFIIDIHYSICFNSDKVREIISESIEGNIKYSKKVCSEVINDKIRRNKNRKKSKTRKEFLSDIKKKYEINYNMIMENKLAITLDWFVKISQLTGLSEQVIKRTIEKINPLLLEEIKNEIRNIRKKKKKEKIKVAKYGNREDYMNAIRRRYEENQKKYIKIIYESDIDFSRFGWVSKVANLINQTPQKVKKWMLRMMPDFYEKKCYKRYSRS